MRTVVLYARKGSAESLPDSLRVRPLPGSSTINAVCRSIARRIGRRGLILAVHQDGYTEDSIYYEATLGTQQGAVEGGVRIIVSRRAA